MKKLAPALEFNKYFIIFSALLLYKSLGWLPKKTGGKTSLAPEAEGSNFKTLLLLTFTDICLNNQYNIHNLKQTF